MTQDNTEYPRRAIAKDWDSLKTKVASHLSQFLDSIPDVTQGFPKTDILPYQADSVRERIHLYKLPALFSCLPGHLIFSLRPITVISNLHHSGCVAGRVFDFGNSIEWESTEELQFPPSVHVLSLNSNNQLCPSLFPILSLPYEC